jgi:tetratricopeptide (TPR) repeat protein
VAVYFLYILVVYWNADKAYGLGQNLVNAGDYQSAYQPLQQAVQMRPEPTFEDELSLDEAVLSVALAQQSKSASGTPTQLAQDAVAISNDLTTNHPNIVTYWKTRVRIMYSLAQLNPQYIQDALAAIQKAALLAPTDAKVSYNLGLLLGQTGHLQEAITTLQNTILLKKDYRDAYYALGIFYHAAGVDKSGKVTNADDAQHAIDEMHFILNNFSVTDQQAKDALRAWGAQ